MNMAVMYISSMKKNARTLIIPESGRTHHINKVLQSHILRLGSAPYSAAYRRPFASPGRPYRPSRSSTSPVALSQS